MFHEAFDAARAGVVGVAHAAGDFGLVFEGQAVLGAAGEKMQVTAHRPEEILRAREALRLLGRQHLEIDQGRDVVDAVDVFGDPEQGVEIAQGPLAFLDVGLDQVARIAEPAVALVALGELVADEFGGRALGDLGLERLLEIVVEFLLAPDVARLEDGGADGEIGLGGGYGLVDRARRLPHLEAQIPQRVEHVFHHLLDMRRRLVGQQEEEIDVGIGRQLAAAVTADGDQRHLLARSGIGRRIDPGLGEVVKRADDLIHQEGQRVRGFGAGGPGFETLLNHGAAGDQRLLEHGAHVLARGRARSRFGQRFEFRLNRAAVDDVARVGDRVHAVILYTGGGRVSLGLLSRVSRPSS